jgi:DNA-binding transcriptional regulator YhcF (GntR family)
LKDFDAIRGKKPTKTELILNYLVSKPGEVVSPKEVADDLDFNLQTTVTVLNRLALEGAIRKEGRGQFIYKKKGKEKTIGTKSKEKSLKIDSKTAAIIYRSIYNMASDSAGEGLIGTITGLSQDDFDEKEPVKSIKDLVRALIDLLGEEIADDIVSIALESELTSEENIEVKQILAR